MKRTLILAFLGIALAVSAVAFDKTPNAATEPLANILGFHKYHNASNKQLSLSDGIDTISVAFIGNRKKFDKDDIRPLLQNSSSIERIYQMLEGTEVKSILNSDFVNKMTESAESIGELIERWPAKFKGSSKMQQLEEGDTFVLYEEWTANKGSNSYNRAILFVVLRYTSKSKSYYSYSSSNFAIEKEAAFVTYKQSYNEL